MLSDDWHKVCRVEELGEEEVIAHQVGEQTLAVYRVDGTFYATADACAHEGTSLSEGYVEAGVIECPLHQGRYRIATGEALSGPACADLAVYPADTDNGWVYVQYAEDIE